MDDVVWDHSTFSKNRDRLLEGEIAARFLSAVLAQARIKRLLSSEHFSVDGHADRGVGFDEEFQAEGAGGRLEHAPRGLANRRRVRNGCAAAQRVVTEGRLPVPGDEQLGTIQELRAE